MDYCHTKECAHLFLPKNFNSGTIFVFVLGLVTVFDFGLLCELQNRPGKTFKIFIYIFLFFQNTWLNVFSHGLVTDL